MNAFKFFLLFLLFTGHALAAQNPRHAQAREAAAADRARLDRATLVLTDSDHTSDRLAALHEIVNLAGRHATVPAELERLLLRATGDPDPEIAGLATRVLDNRDHPAEPEAGSDEEIRERAEARRLRWAAEVLSRPEPPDRSDTDRLAAVHTLVHLASSRRHWSGDLEWLVAHARRDTDFEIAYLAEKVLARHEGRPIDPRFVRPDTRSQETRAARSELERRTDARYAATDDPNPNVRLSSLHWVLDIALSEGGDSDPRILETLIAHRTDPEPFVANFVRFALESLTGDRNALREVYVDR